jgi:uncharacterized caspase-like protein
MKHLKQLACTLFLFLPFLLQAQEEGYEAWRQKKEREYARWQKLRAETGHLRVSPEEEAISDYINAGFGNEPAPERPSQSAPPPAVVETTAAPAASAGMKVWVVVVGVADYRHIDKLNYTDDDAYRMYAFYKSPEGGSLPDSQIRVLIDEDATRDNVMQALNSVYSRAASNDAIIFFFSGHGARDAFITQEYNRTDNRGLLMHSEIQAIFDRSAARYKYIIADACHSGSWAQKGVKGSATEQQYYQAFERSRGGFVLLLSSMGNEYSLESSGFRQGIFSHFLIRGLKGEADANGDNVVSIIELYEFVESRVAQTTERRQNPVLSGDYKGNPPVSIVHEANLGIVGK